MCSLGAAVAAIVLGMGLAFTTSQARGGEPEIVARVNGDAVTRHELQRMVADPRMRRLYQREAGAGKADGQELERWALRKLIVKRLMLQEATKRNITVTDRELDLAVALWKARMKGPKKVEKYLKSRAMDEDSLRNAIRADMLVTRVRAVVAGDVGVADEQVRDYYEAHRTDFEAPAEVRLLIVTVKDMAAADEILAAIHRGEDFERLARERPMQAAQADDRGWLAAPGLPPPVQAAVDRLKPGEISEPLQGGGEVIILRLEDRRPARTKTLEEVRPEIEQQLLPQRQRAASQAWLMEQEKTSKIEILMAAGSEGPRIGGSGTVGEGWTNASVALDEDGQVK